MKVTMGSVCLEAINNSECDWSVAELWEICKASGLNVVEAQVYANLQVYASTKRIKRGTTPRTFRTVKTTVAKLVEDVPPMPAPVKEIPLKEAPVKRTRTKKEPVIVAKTKKTTKSDPDPLQIIADLTSKLGEPSATYLKEQAYVILPLPGEGYCDAEYIIDRWNSVLGGITEWLWYTTGSGYMFGGINEPS